MRNFSIRKPRHSGEILIEKDVLWGSNKWPKRLRRYAQGDQAQTLQAKGWTVFYAAGTGWIQHPVK